MVTLNQENMHFADNRILLSINLAPGQSAECEVRGFNTQILHQFQVFSSGEQHTIVDISDVVQSMLREKTPDLPVLETTNVVDNESFFSVVAPYAEYTIKVRIINMENQTAVSTTDLGLYRAFPGGLNRSLLNMDGSVFTKKRLDRSVQNILTTRTASKDIVMKECELYPLYLFLERIPRATIQTKTITVISEGKTISLSLQLRGSNFDELYALNVENIRKEFLNTHDIFSTQMDFYLDVIEEDETPGKAHLCSVTITEDNSTKPLILLFKNTFGVYEKKALNPLFEVESKFEKSVYQKLDSNHEFAKQSPRAVRSDVMAASLSINSTEEFIFAMDILHSDDVWLEYQGKKQPVLVSTDSVARSNNFKPFSMALSIEPRMTDPFAPVDFLQDSGDKIFDLSFDDTFE